MLPTIHLFNLNQLKPTSIDEILELEVFLVYMLTLSVEAVAPINLSTLDNVYINGTRLTQTSARVITYANSENLEVRTLYNQISTLVADALFNYSISKRRDPFLILHIELKLLRRQNVVLTFDLF